MRKIIPFLIMILVPTISAIIIIQQTKRLGEGAKVDLDTNFTHICSVDHSRFEILNKDFESGPEVTEACLSCHNGRGAELMQTSHWKWSREEHLKGKGIVPLGKKNIINNFCIGISGSEATCTRCHIGYGWTDKTFDFSKETNIDCLVCHDNTETYQKDRGVGGLPKADVDLSYVARNIGLPKRANCGVCHFWGGGGNNVKHGDLDKAMLDCSRKVDVHMGTDGMDMSCIECHTAENHKLLGKAYALSSENKDRATCEQCHTEEPHIDQLLNEHTLRIACQTCHIPTYAKANSTKMVWDWSTAGELDDKGEPQHWNDQDGNHKYMSIKGTFIWNNDVVPEYYWFNGTANHHLVEEKIDTTNLPLQMNTLYGSYTAIDSVSNAPSKIWPVKVHRGKQIYDSKNLTLIQPKLWDKEKGKGAYWIDFDWQTASEKGMEYIGMDYSGEYDFIETEMYWPLNHQVAEKEKSLKCKDCHVRENGRLAKINDFYMPGRDRIATLDYIGYILIILTIIGVIVHTILRIKYRRTCFFDDPPETK